MAFTSLRACGQLPVTLSADAARLHSPLAVYVVGACAARDTIRVQVAIAPEMWPPRCTY
ncbi:hypothetical protein [Burkholderia vietnamiensis]|uniref:hypothetical protein n=1 Tax=Burkholderia vietnamiensis TaxID=60552 RepID=UPI000A889ED5|nr:hypothetical protein [Burkholderia vietnamiensis]